MICNAIEWTDLIPNSHYHVTVVLSSLIWEVIVLKINLYMLSSDVNTTCTPCSQKLSTIWQLNSFQVESLYFIIFPISKDIVVFDIKNGYTKSIITLKYVYATGEHEKRILFSCIIWMSINAIDWFFFY